MLLVCATAFGQQGATIGESTKISELAYGDYYWVVQHHDADIEGMNGFWFRRVYLTVDQTLSDTLSARLRFETMQPGDFKTNSTAVPFIKDAWVKWHRSANLDVVVGMSPSPTWEGIEQFWGYRSVEKTPVDLQRMGSPRDFGVALLGKIGAGSGVRYHFMIGNGAGTGSETNAGKLVALSTRFDFNSSTFIELYGDHDDRPGRTDRTTWQGFLGWQRGGNRIGVQYSRQIRDVETGPRVNLGIASVFGVYSLKPKVALILRVDRMFDPNPEGEKIPYLPFDATSRSTLFITGSDFKLHKRFGLIPNVEWIVYDSRAHNVRGDVVPRITFYYVF